MSSKAGQAPLDSRRAVCTGLAQLGKRCSLVGNVAGNGGPEVRNVAPKKATNFGIGTLARAPQPARGVAGHDVALHADPAHIHTLVDLFGVVSAVVLGDTAPLFRGVVDLLRTGRQSHGKQRYSGQPSPSHGELVKR